MSFDLWVKGRANQLYFGMLGGLIAFMWRRRIFTINKKGIVFIFGYLEPDNPVGCIPCTITKFVGGATGWLESMTWEFAEIEMVRKTHPTLLNGVRRSLYSQYSYPEMAEIKNNPKQNS